MTRIGRSATIWIGLASLALSSPMWAQDGSRARPGESAVALDQVPAPTSAPASDSPQPSTISRSAAVTSAEIPASSTAHLLTTAPIAGGDLCDGNDAARRKDLCRQRIEERADEYRRPSAAPVTAEGRLLLLTGKGQGGGAGTQPLGAIAGLNDLNGPAEQLAGALQAQAPGTKGEGSATPSSGSPTVVPAGVPSIVVLPR